MSQMPQSAAKPLLTAMFARLALVLLIFVINPLIALVVVSVAPDFARVWPPFDKLALHCTQVQCTMSAQFVGTTYSLHAIAALIILFVSSVVNWSQSGRTIGKNVKIMLIAIFLIAISWSVGNFEFVRPTFYSNRIDINPVYIYYPIPIIILAIGIPVLELIAQSKKIRWIVEGIKRDRSQLL